MTKLDEMVVNRKFCFPLSPAPVYARPTPFDLIHAAALTGQQLKLGIPVHQALRKSCLDVYVNSTTSNLGDSQLTDAVKACVDDWLSAPVPADLGPVMDVSLGACPTLRDLHFTPDVACARREALALNLIVRAASRKPQFRHEAGLFH